MPKLADIILGATELEVSTIGGAHLHLFRVPS
jgi:hypothetical protein